MLAHARIGLVTLALLAPAGVRAEHDHAPIAGGPTRPFGVAVGLVAASYDQMLYTGEYQAVVPAARWTRGRFATSITLPLYRLVENGRTVYGAGDVVATGQASVLEHGAARAGVALALGLPTGAHESGLGMGHVMVMPALWASAATGRITLAGSAGFGRALGGQTHGDHGAWPIVDPMNRTELIAGASVSVAVTHALQAGVRATGAAPIGDGDARAIGGVRAVWTAGRVATTVELAAGIAGDPFTLRGVLETALSF